MHREIKGKYALSDASLGSSFYRLYADDVVTCRWGKCNARARFPLCRGYSRLYTLKAISTVKDVMRS